MNLTNGLSRSRKIKQAINPTLWDSKSTTTAKGGGLNVDL